MDNKSLARELIGQMVTLSDDFRAAIKFQLRELDITDAQADTLWRLSGEEAMSARRLAERLNCDASTVTSMIDRLEKQGMVRRVPHPTDRRVKLIQLTEAGCEVRDRLLRYTAEQSPFALLDRGSQEQLHELLGEAVALIRRAEKPS